MDLTRRGLIARAAAAVGAGRGARLLAPGVVFAGADGERVFELRVPGGKSPVIETKRTFELLGLDAAKAYSAPAPHFSLGLGVVDAAAAAQVVNPPNPNAALDQFISTDLVTGLPIFQTASWATAAQSDASWATASWATASWATASWATASWATASWATASWATASWATAS